MFVITGASGNTGKIAAIELLKSGHKVKAIGRNAEKMQDLKDLGAELAIGDLHNTDFLTKEFADATAVYAVIPPNFTTENFRQYQNEVGSAINTALINANVNNVAVLSSIGAHLTENAGVVQGLYDFEQMFNKNENLNAVYLRAGYFFQNLFGQMHTIKNMGIMGSPMNGDMKVPMVYTGDIGKVAAEELINLSEGKVTGKKVRYVAGQRDLSNNEVAKIIGNSIGIENLPYVQFPYADAKAAMMAGGLTDSLSTGYLELSKSANEGKLLSDYVRNETNTTETSIEWFAENVFAPVYKAQF